MPEYSNPFKKKIEGKIASIITKKNVVINRGARHGVKEGMYFSVDISIGKIEDPDDPTNTLGGLSLEKARIKVTSVYDTMSYCAILGTPGYPLLRGWRELTQVEYPSIGDKAMLSEDAWKLRRGDPVQAIIEDDEEKD